MKPTCPVARRGDYSVRDVPMADAVAFIRSHHYAKGCSQTAVYRHGLFRDNILVGVALWLPPTKRCAMTVHEHWQRVLSLSRLAVAPTEPQNAASILIGASIRLIRREGEWKALVTFADDSQGHTGTIYRATNWIYRGKTSATPRWEDSNGRQVARLSTRSRSISEMKSLGYTMVGKFAKHKFVLALDGSLIPLRQELTGGASCF
jgi:hypothetical protein